MSPNKNIKQNELNISQESGFTLIEVIIAVLILGIAVVALLEVMAVGWNMNASMKDQKDVLDVAISNIDTTINQEYKEPPQSVDIDTAEGWEVGLSSLVIKKGLLQKITSNVNSSNNEQASITTYLINKKFKTDSESFVLSQHSYRWYENIDSYTPTTALSEKNDILTKVRPGKIIRLRISIKAGAVLNKDSQQFKLEYSTNTEDGWTQVGNIGSVSKVWTGSNNFSSEDAGDTTVLLEGNNISQSYEEQNPSVANKQQIGAGETGEWDWVIKENGANPDTVYFFRMVLINGTHLDRYMRYATLRTSPQTSYIQKNYRWYENSDSVTPATALSGEGTARVSTVYGEKYRLRISLEVDGNLVSKTTQAFNLQYATEISGTWTYLGDVGSNDAWIGVNNSSVQDEVVIPSLLLSTSTLSGTYQEEKKSGLNPVAINIQGQMEFDWAIKDNTNNQSATKYYFRIVDANGIPLSYYSIYPTITVPPVFVVGNLTNNAATDLYPSWSPDGTKIAFGTNRDGNYEIYVMNADGSNLINLTNNAAADDYPSWSPDGTKIAFGTNRDGNYEIYVMNADGSNLINLTNNAAADSHPSWSPDGTKIVFYTARDGNYEIYVMNADGSNLINLTNNAAADLYPSWSPDGTKIAFGTNRDGNDEIYVMNADGSNLTNLTNNAAADSRPSWSPDGTKIVFYTARDGNDEIYVMNADGSNLINLTNNAAADSRPSWSPDGTKIAFGTNRDGNYEIYVMIVP